jgi:creatinine deaminase
VRLRRAALEWRIDNFLEAAIEEARIGLREGGVPIGSVLVCDGEIIGRGRNQRVQRGSVIHHAEMNCLENAGRQKASVYARCTIYSTLSPCPMCSGAIVLYKIPRVIIGENVTFQGGEETMRANGIRLEVVQNEECIQLMRDFVRDKPELWNEDIGV